MRIMVLFAVAAAASEKDAAFFDKRVAPILMRRCLGCHNKEPRWQTPGEQRDECGVGRTRQAGYAKPSPRFGKRIDHSRKRGQAFDRIEQTGERH